jgi:GxxExxY protein
MELTATGAKDAKEKEEDRLRKLILDAAFRVHSALGPGLLESAYEACLAYELRNEGLNVATQVPLPLIYKEVRLDVGYRLDLLVEDLVVIE